MILGARCGHLFCPFAIEMRYGSDEINNTDAQIFQRRNIVQLEFHENANLSETGK
jgi:hypothetical protein